MMKLKLLALVTVAFTGYAQAIKYDSLDKGQQYRFNTKGGVTIGGVAYTAKDAAGNLIPAGQTPPPAPAPTGQQPAVVVNQPDALPQAVLNEIQAYAAANPADANRIVNLAQAIGPNTNAYVGG